MTHDQFLQRIEGYYGEYKHPATRGVVLTYIQKEYSKKRLDQLYAVLIYNYVGEYGLTPNVAVMQKLRPEIDRQSSVPEFKLIDERPDEEQREEVAGMLSGLVDRLKPGPFQDKTDPYDDEIQR